MKLVVTLSIGLVLVLTCTHGVVWTTEGESEIVPAGADSSERADALAGAGEDSSASGADAVKSEADSSAAAPAPSADGPDSSDAVPAPSADVPDSSAAVPAPSADVPDSSAAGAVPLPVGRDSSFSESEFPPDSADTSGAGLVLPLGHSPDSSGTAERDTSAYKDWNPYDTFPSPIAPGESLITVVEEPVWDSGYDWCPGYAFGPGGDRLRCRFQTPPPEFMLDPALAVTYDEALAGYWVDRGRSRTFVAVEKTLADYSSIDIPITFPDRIGRVIGQGANLAVSGSEKISFGGQTRYDVNERATEFGKRSRFPTLDMKQHLKIDLTGTVGEKIHVTVHHDSEIDTPLENRIKLKYQGYDDEIVQSIEMGNTNLNLPGSRFVSYSGMQQGLFGAKMLARLGDLDLTLIASKQEGRTASHSFVGAGSRDSTVINDIAFVRNKYFFVQDPYQLVAGNTFSDIVVYVDDGDGTNNDDTGALEAYAFLDPLDLPPEAGWDSLAYQGNFDVLEVNRDYAINLQTGEISFLRALSAPHFLAVTYVYDGQPVGGLDGQDRLILKMIRPSDTYMIEKAHIWQPTLDLMRKNIYSLGASFISEDQVEVSIFRKEGDVDTDAQGDFLYSKILGIDLRDEYGEIANEGNGWNTDLYADGGTINGESGLLLFPDLRPFDPLVTPEDRPAALEVTNPEIYDEHHNNLKESENSKYYIKVRYSTPQTTWKLQHINILENSETITLNGVRLVKGVDYEIYYDIGQIRFKTEEAARPDAEISVNYQFVPFFALAQQTLVGAQGMYRLSPKSYLGSLWLYQSKKSPEERPRLGQEPSQIVMGDVNGMFEFNPELMTSMVNALPFVRADARSRLSIAAEVGLSFPNPNTKGDVYVDDMEGVEDVRSFPVLRESWVPASASGELRWEDTRGMWWYIKDKEVREQDIFPNAESKPGESFIPVLELDFKDQKYVGGLEPADRDTVDFDPAGQWGGLMRLVSKTGADYTDLRFFEVWIREKSDGFDGGDSVTMHVDLGAVSEDFYRPWRPGVLNTEDQDNNGKLSVDENTGYDGVFTGDPDDDPFDDWYYSEGNYSQINGTEDNPRTVPDTEDLDDDGNLDTDEVYYRLSFSLQDTSYVANESGDWRLYRIPLTEGEAMGGTPSWRSIRYMRFFFTGPGIGEGSVFQIASLQIAGTSWLNEGVRVKPTMLPPDELLPGEAFEIAAKNTRDDPDYVPPYDPGVDAEGYKKREQTLVFGLRNIAPGNSGSAYRTLPGQGSDYTLYQTLAFYVRGDERSESEDVHLFVRIGTDSINFYEYATRVEYGWKSVAVPLETITNLKSEEASTDSIYGREVDFRRTETADGWIAVYGAPSLTRVSRVSAGVVNSGDSPTASSGMEVWFNDLRLTDVRKDPGFAKRLSVAASFSDLFTVTADYENTDSEFQTVSTKRTGSDDTRYSFNFNTTLERWLPLGGIAAPFSMRYSRSNSLPTLQSKSDIALLPEQRKLWERTSSDNFYRLSLSKRAKSNNPLLKLTVDALSGGMSYSRKRGDSPELADTTYGYTGDITYNFSPWWSNSIGLFKGYRIAYMPGNISGNVTGSAKDTKKFDKRQGVVKEDRYTRSIKGNIGITAKPITGPALETDYSLKIFRDLDTNKNLPIVNSVGWGKELKRNQRVGLRIRPTFGGWMKPTFSYDVNYDENGEPSVRAADDPASVRRASVSARSTIDFIVIPASAFSIPRTGTVDSVGPPVYKRIISKVPDITMSYVYDRSSKYQKVLARPDFAFQLGLDTKLPEDIIYAGVTGSGQQTDEHVQTRGFNASSDFQPVPSLSVEARYKRDKSSRTYAGATSFNYSEVWPDISGNVSTLWYLNVFGGALKSTSLAFGYRGTVTERGTGTSTVTNRVNRSEWLPLLGWDATWSNGVRTTLNFRHSNTETRDLKGAGTLKTSKSTAVSFSVSHSFSAPQGMYIPLAGRTFRFKSNLTLNLDFNYETRLDKVPSAGDRIDTDTRKFSIIPRASYSFSKSITGSANARFEQQSDRQLGQTWRTIGLSASVLIRF
jgi:hypothetical protein